MKKIISILLLSIVAFPMVWAQDSKDPLYNVECSTTDLGTVYALPRYAAAGTTVILRAVPNDGYQLSEFFVMKSTDFSTVDVTMVNETDATFVMPECDVTVTAMYSPKSFSIIIDQSNQGYGVVYTNPQSTAPAGQNVKVIFLSNYIGEGSISTNLDISRVIVEKVNAGGFSGDEPWEPANAPRVNDNSGHLVEVTQNRFYEYEFIMPTSDVLITPVIEEIQSVSLRQLADSGEVGKVYSISDEDLAIAYYDASELVIYAKDNNHADEQVQPESSIDYVKQSGMQQSAWDHSNWVALDHLLIGPNMPSYEKNKVITKVRGKLLDATNLQMMVAENPLIPTDDGGAELTMEFTTNNFIPANYYGTQVGTNGNTYFLVAPAANEYADINWAVWNADNQSFDIIRDGVNAEGLQGSFPATFASSFDTTQLENGKNYVLQGITKLVSDEGAEEEHYSVYVVNARIVVRGDINGDGAVDVSDLNIMINIMLGKAQANGYPGIPDLNVDGIVDVSDINIIVNIMLGRE